MARRTVLPFLAAVLATTCAIAQDGDLRGDVPNSLLLVASPGLADPNFSQTVVLVTQTPDSSTVGVILNRPSGGRHEKNGAPVYFGGPVMRAAIVALFRSEAPPPAPAFHMLKRIYLTMHPDNVDALLAQPARRYRLYAGFSGWMPGQLESEMERDAWYVVPATEELLFREDTTGMWAELLQEALGRKAELFPR